ncbi:MAG: signal peptidase I, partial [Actinomycetota bacterium]
MTNSDETTDVVGPAADLDAGGLVAPATAPLPGSLEHPDVEVVAPTETIMAPADTIADAPAPAQAPFVLDDPGILPAPDPDTWVDEPAPIDPQRWTLGEVASLTGRFVSVFWAMTVMWLVVFSFLPLVVGWTPTVVSTGSMAPAVSAGTVVHVDSGVDPQILGPGSIITFEDPRFAGRSVTHRVIEPIRDTTTGPIIGFRTKGDANAAEDSEIVPVAAVDGAVRLVLPYAGLPQVWLDDGRWWIVAFLLLGTLIAAVVAFDTLGGFITGRTMFRRRSVASAVAIA